MKLACRKCGREYELPADLTARGIYQITCKACGQPVSADAAADRLRQAAGMDHTPMAGVARSAPPPLGAAPRRAAAPPPAARPGDDYVDLFADAAAEPDRPVPPPAATLPPPSSAPRSSSSPIGSSAASLARERPARALDLGSGAGERAGNSRTLLVLGGGVVVLVLVVVGALFLFRRPDVAVPPFPSATARSMVISTAAPPLAAPDPEIAAAEAREDAGRYARLRESLKQTEEPPEPVERRPTPGPAPRDQASVLVGAVRPTPSAVAAQVPQVPAQREALATPAQAAAPAVARPAAAPGEAVAVEEAPAFPTAGFEKPTQVVPGCVRNSVRLPRDLAATLSGTLTVRFAVSRNGSVGLIQVMDQVPDSRISDAVVAAVKSCDFRPGNDASGRPTRMWVVMPLRFVGG